MNWQAKRAGQLLVVAVLFFFISCEDDSLLLGFKGNSKFKGRVQEFTFSGDASSSFLLDSVITHNATGTQRFLVGQYLDPDFGTVSSTVFTQFQPTVTGRIGDGSATLLSAELRLLFDYYYYGPASADDFNEQYSVHRITEDSISHSVWYYYNSSFGYDPTPIAEFNLEMSYFNLNYYKGRSDRDSVANASLTNVDLDPAFAHELFSYIMVNDSLLKSAYNKVFRTHFKGLAIVPKNNKYIVGFNPANVTLNNIILRYKSGQDTLQRIFSLSALSGAMSFSNIETTRTNELAGAQPNQKVSPVNGNRYLQNGSPVISHIDIKPFYEFIRGKNDDDSDSLKHIIINSAEFSIGVETPPAGMDPPSSLVLQILKKPSETEFIYLDNTVETDSLRMIKHRVMPYSGFYTIEDESSNPFGLLSSRVPATLTYNASRQAYIGNTSLFFQNIFDNRNADDIDLYYIALVPVNPAMGKTVNRVVLKSDQMKLRIHYIKPN